MAWINPIPLALMPDMESRGFERYPEGITGLPTGSLHPGSFGYQRANHVHEGVDIYCPAGTPVRAVEDGTVVAIIEFTGSRAEPPSPWWHDTQAILIEGPSGVVLYGEVGVGDGMSVGMRVEAGTEIGRVRQVLKKDKNPPRPMSMLHLELHVMGTRDAYEWTVEGGRPASLLDPTGHLAAIAESR